MVRSTFHRCCIWVNSVAADVRGYYEPLCASYRRTCLESIERFIQVGMFKVSKLYEAIRLRGVSEEQILLYDPSLQSFLNLNGPTQVKQPGHSQQAGCSRSGDRSE